MAAPNFLEVPDEDLPEVLDAYEGISPEVRDRIMRKIQIEILANNREFLNALAWEVDCDCDCQGPPPDQGDNP